MALTTAERDLFTSAQLVQLDRFTGIEARLEVDGSPLSADARAGRLARWAARGVTELRAIVNVREVQWARSGIVLVPSADSDYSEADLAGITEELRGGDDWVAVAAQVVAAGGSVEQRLTALGG